jgi:membrane protein DedA with SNARE-associated domain
MEWLHQWLDQMLNTNWAYLVLFVWTIFEGETCLILAGAFSTDGTPNIFMCMLAAFVGSFSGDQIWFQVGRIKGTSMLIRRPAWKPKAQRVFALLERHSTWLILTFRFFYGLRTVTPFAIGMSSVSTRRYMILNAIGAAVWAVSFAVLGYVFGTVVATYLENRKHRMWAILAVAVAVFLIWLFRTISRIIKLRKAKRQTPQAEPATAVVPDPKAPPK